MNTTLSLLMVLFTFSPSKAKKVNYYLKVTIYCFNILILILHILIALGNSDTSTEVISLSDWMHESTMFNIITNIQFFKNYAITKIFNIWKANVHYRIFCKTRKRLIHDTFIAKPAFA